MAPFLRRGNALWLLLQFACVFAASFTGWRRGSNERWINFSVSDSRADFTRTLNVTYFLSDEEAYSDVSGLLNQTRTVPSRYVFVGSPVSRNGTSELLTKLEASVKGETWDRIPYATLPTETSHHVRRARAVYKYLQQNWNSTAAVFLDPGLGYLALSGQRSNPFDKRHYDAVLHRPWQKLHKTVEVPGNRRKRSSPYGQLIWPQTPRDLEAIYMERKSTEWVDSAPYNIGKSGGLTLVNTGPTISVIITVYERFDYLTSAILSIIFQDYSGTVEIIVVDDGSSSRGSQEKLAAILRESKENMSASKATTGPRTLKLLNLEANSYLGRARNHGRRIATGDILMFMDDDNVGELVAACSN
jgi:hypothetical protein